MEETYYYADDSRQPVGPLSLTQIRELANARIVDPDVMVCVADGEKWQPLSTLIAVSRPGGHAAAPPLSRAPQATASRLSFLLIHTIIAVIISFVIDLVSTGAAMANGGVDPSGSRIFLSLVAALWAMGAELALIYHLCSALPVHLRFATPAKATWFLIIPGFHLYWAFRLYPELAGGASKWSEEAAKDGSAARDVSWMVSLGYVVATLVAFITFFMVLEVFGAIPLTMGGQLFYAAYSGVALFFYASLVGVMRRLLGND